MALKQDGVQFVVCPKQGSKTEGVVLNFTLEFINIGN